MKNALFLKVLISVWFLPFLLVSTGSANEWTLAWSDEFNYQGPLNSSKWRYEEGILRNNESGYFTNRLKNVRVEGGRLVIEAHKEAYSNANYTTGSIHTRNKKHFKYGRLEVRAKMPYGYGSHVGIWFSGANSAEVGWPASGELDVAEYIGRVPHTIHIYAHYSDPENPTQSARSVIGKFQVLNPYNSFHIYAMEWDETQVKYFIDNRHVATFNLDEAGTGSDNPFRKDQIFRLTYALGGWGWEVDDSVLPQTFEVDYVRFYKPAAIIAPANMLLLQSSP